jgi:hypothetical protein
MDLVNEELKKSGGNLSRTARVLGIDYKELREHLPPVAPFRPTLGPEPDDITTLGRHPYQQFVIAAKRAGCGWPDKYDHVLQDAREKFDRGTHDMFQANSKGWVIQYLIPLRSPVSPRNFFKERPIDV